MMEIPTRSHELQQVLVRSENRYCMMMPMLLTRDASNRFSFKKKNRFVPPCMPPLSDSSRTRVWPQRGIGGPCSFSGSGVTIYFFECSASTCSLWNFLKHVWAQSIKWHLEINTRDLEHQHSCIWFSRFGLRCYGIGLGTYVALPMQ